MSWPAAATTRHASSQRRLSASQVVIYALLGALSLLFLAPFAWLVVTSLKEPAQVFSPDLIPIPPSFRNYADVFRYAPVLTWLSNSLLVSLLATGAVLLSSSLVAYGFARLRFPYRNALFALVMATYLLPGAATMVPTFLIWNQFNAVNTFYPLWAGNLFGSAVYIFMLRQFLLTIPHELVEAARVDGASYLGIFWRIMLPLIVPALVVVGLFEFKAKWDDFQTPLIYLNRRELYTLPLGLATFKTDYEMNWALWMAAAVIFTLPMILLFFLAQRSFIEGIATTGLKG